jgi:hypothetical protein
MQSDGLEIVCLNNHVIKRTINVKRDVQIQMSFCGDIACGIAIWKYPPLLYT